jgi:hypothetical protein
MNGERMSTDLHSHLSAVAPVVTAAFAWGLHGKTHLCSDGQPGLPRHYRYPIDVSYNLYYIYINTNCIHADSEIKPMPDLKEILKIVFLIKSMIAFLRLYLSAFRPF